jgi:hypothetical protein
LETWRNEGNEAHASEIEFAHLLAIHTHRFAYASEDQRDDKEDNKEVTVHIPQVELQLLPSVRHSKFRWHARPPRSRKVLIILGSCVPFTFSGLFK